LAIETVSFVSVRFTTSIEDVRMSVVTPSLRSPWQSGRLLAVGG
jgi:hypothetical protein